MYRLVIIVTTKTAKNEELMCKGQSVSALDAWVEYSSHYYYHNLIFYVTILYLVFVLVLSLCDGLKT